MFHCHHDRSVGLRLDCTDKTKSGAEKNNPRLSTRPVAPRAVYHYNNCTSGFTTYSVSRTCHFTSNNLAWVKEEKTRHCLRHFADKSFRVATSTTVREFVTFGLKKKLKFAKIPLTILGLLWAHSTGCSGAVPQLISVATDWCLTAWVHVNLGQ